MRIFSLPFGAVAALLLAANVASAQPVPAVRSASDLALEIDRHLAKRQADAKVKPAELAADAEFVRRIYLDLVGRVPTVSEARSFLADKALDRRQRLVDRLLASPRFASHFAAIYRAILIPEAGNNFLVRFQQGGFEDWLKDQFTRNAGYDQLTRELLTFPLEGGNPFGAIGLGGGPSAVAFYSAKEFKAESLAAGAARVFLGVRVECAQCHNHPFANWKRDQFWALAAFFAGIEGQRRDGVVPGRENRNKREITIPGTETVVKARFLDGAEPNWQKSDSTRAVLADWIASPRNPYFARAAVNRTWAYLLGAGLIEPVDEMVGTSSTAAHPELLALLAQEFVDHQFDVKFLIRAIVLSDAYQRTSAGKGKLDPVLYARMPLRGLTPEQLIDSLVTATAHRDTGDGKESLLDAIAGKPSARAQLLTKFANQSERAVLSQTSILQALTLMNGKVIDDATSLGRSETLAAILDAPFLSTTERIETLYLAALSRRPDARELDRMTRFVDDAVRESQGRNGRAYDNAMADVFWVLLNSAEFSLNH